VEKKGFYYQQEHRLGKGGGDRGTDRHDDMNNSILNARALREGKDWSLEQFSGFSRKRIERGRGAIEIETQQKKGGGEGKKRSQRELYQGNGSTAKKFRLVQAKKRKTAGGVKNKSET